MRFGYRIILRNLCALPIVSVSQSVAHNVHVVFLKVKERIAKMLQVSI